MIRYNRLFSLDAVGFVSVLLFSPALTLAQNAISAAESIPRPHVLLVGLDGVRVDALLRAHTPTVDSLRKTGAFSDNCRSVMPSRSGPGWTTILSGQYPEVHGVLDNKLGGWKTDAAPTLPSLLRSAGIQGRISATTHWEPLGQLMVGADDLINRDSDADVEIEAMRLLEFENPEFLFVHFDNGDHMGHTFGFHPWLFTYTGAIAGLDARLGRLCAGVRARPNYAQENWLIVVTSDHGGHLRHHGDDVESDRRIFLLLSGGAVKAGSLLGETSIADVTPTIMAHYQIAPPEGIAFGGVARGMNLITARVDVPSLGKTQ